MALIHVDFFSQTLGMCTQMNVILPETARGLIGMDGSAQKENWKVLYLLHGLSDDHTIWERRTSIERYASAHPLAVVMPETQRGWYTDMKCGFPWFSYFTKELPRIVHSFFPNISTRREDTFVAGLSMGGYGALKLALCCPEQYACAASLSGAVDIAELCENWTGDVNREFQDVFGPFDAIRGGENDLFHLASELKNSERPKPRLFMCCGLQDSLYWQNVRLRNHLKSLEMDLTYEEEPGDHRWEYWDMKIQRVLEWLPLEGEGK